MNEPEDGTWMGLTMEEFRQACLLMGWMDPCPPPVSGYCVGGSLDGQYAAEMPGAFASPREWYYFEGGVFMPHQLGGSVIPSDVVRWELELRSHVRGGP